MFSCTGACWKACCSLSLACRRRPAGGARQFALAVFLAVKMAVPIGFKMQNDYYFHSLVKQAVQMTNGG